jgi:hypothetical protein
MKTIVGGHPLEKRIEKKTSSSATILSLSSKSLISFSPNTLHHTEHNHLSNSFTLRTTKVSSPTRRSLTRQGMTYTKPNKPKIEIHKALAILQWSRRWSMVSPLFLHMQYQSITVIFHFLKLFKVMILPKATDQAKKATFKGALLRQIHLQGKGVLSLGIKTL